ncbi:MAG: hypothetical protein R3Y07_03845 [Eubacteriales bacterium]
MQAEIEVEKTEIARLKEHEAQLDVYLSSTEENRILVDSIMEAYPQEVRSEDLIMFANNMQTDVGIDVLSLEVVQGKSTNKFSVTRFIDDVDVVIPVSAYTTTVNLTANFTYAQLKSMIDYSHSEPYRTVVNSVTVAYDSTTGQLTGKMAVNKYFLATSEYVYDPTIIPSVDIGTVNPFGTILDGSSPEG